MKITMSGAKITSHELDTDDSVFTEITHIIPKTEESRFQYFLYRVPGRLGELGEAVDITFETRTSTDAN